MQATRVQLWHASLQCSFICILGCLLLFTCISASTRSNRSAISPPAVAMPHAEPLTAGAMVLARLFGMLADCPPSTYLMYSWEHDTAACTRR